MMKPTFINPCRALYLLLSISAFGVYAQQSPGPATKILFEKGNRAKPYKSPTQQRVEQLLARTTPDYVEKMYGAKSRLLNRGGNSLRTTACEDGYLCSAAALPATLISFDGERLNASTVKLSWETSAETNNAGFDIERSLTAPSVFEKVGFVDGGGNSANSKAYQFPDRNSNENVTYYRLKQLDYDGKFEYSRIIAVKGFKELLSLVPVPNPGPQNSSFLQVKGNDNSGKIQLTIVDVKGFLVYKNEQFVLGNSRQIPLSGLPELATGFYIAKIVSGDQQSTVSFIVAER